MEITEVKVFPVNEEKLKAYITIVLDGCFVVRDLKIISGNTGLFVAMPSKRRKDGAFKDIAHPLNQATRTSMEKTILDAYLAEIKRQGGRTTQSAEQAEAADKTVESS
jgi:stage V sporulation protein G